MIADQVFAVALVAPLVIVGARLRSEKATRHRYAIRGYISTAAKHGTHVFTALRDALTGNPWMPPIPART